MKISHLYATAVILLMFFTISLPASAQSLDEKEDKDEQEEILPGDIAPDFTATDMDGNEFSLHEDASELPVVIDFWATWCPPCVMEFPLLEDFHQAHEGEVTVLAVTSEDTDNEQEINDFLEENDVTFRIIHDPSREIMEQYYVRAIPFVVVVDTSGTVVATHLGYSPEIRETLEEDLGLEPADYPPIEEEEEEDEEE